MSDTTNTNEAILKALRAAAGATVAELAEASGVSRSTAGKALQRLERGGLVERTPGGRDGGRRLPDRFEAAASAPTAEASERLRSGELGSLVLEDLGRRSEPVSPSAIAKSLGRSGGAVANLCGSSVSSATVDEVAEAVGISRTSARHVLADLEQQGQVTRIEGGREGGRRLPDRWALAATGSDEGEVRLGRGQLRELVLEHLQGHPGEEVSPAQLSKTLGRSAGAISNLLAKAAAAGEVTLTSDRPRRYAAASGHRTD